MDFTPHTGPEIASMLSRIGAASVDELFEVIPPSLRLNRALDVPSPLSESELLREFSSIAARNVDVDQLTCFAGAGTYDHHVPSFVWPLLSRGEFLTAYTPYQPELSQGILQALFEYQSMVCSLTGLAVSNAGLYEGATALSEAVNISRAATRRNKVLLAGAIHPHSVQVLETQARGVGTTFKPTPAKKSGTVDLEALEAALDEDTAAVAIQQPNLYGCIEDVAAIAELAHTKGARVIVSADLSLAGVLAVCGDLGADIVVGDGQVFGNHLNFGGPSTGIIAVGEQDIRRLPGRLVGETLDADGKRAYVLTLQAREQHIRREKATSNICTNQTLNTLAVAMTLAWLGPVGLRELGEQCVNRAHYARDHIIEHLDAQPVTTAPFAKEFALRLPAKASDVIAAAASDHVLAGVALSRLDPSADERDILISVTEKRSRADIDHLVDALRRACKEVG